MVLDGLVAEIERVKATIAAHRELLAGSEALTRYALIDPLLRALEWDTADPAQVRPEYRDASGFADYVLMSGDKKAALLEAKRLGVALDQNVTLQALTYCNSIDIEHMIISDGSQWLLYNAFKRGQLQDRITTTFNVDREEAHAVALKALHLWRPNLSAQSITAPPEGVVYYIPAQEAGEAAKPNGVQAPHAPSCDEDWHPLNEVVRVVRSGSTRPLGLCMPDGLETTIRTWKEVLTSTVKWLLDCNKLTSNSQLGLPSSHKTYILNSVPVHSAGQSFRRSAKVGPLYVEVDHPGHMLMEVTSFLLQHCGIDPAAVYLRFDSVA